MKYLKTLLDRKPELLNKYVTCGIVAANLAVIPLNKFLAHLMTVQGIDLNTQPGQKARQALIDAMNAVEDRESYDKEYDFTWVQKHFDKSREQLKHLNLTRDKYRKLTDLSEFGNSPVDTELNRAIPESTKRETRITEPEPKYDYDKPGVMESALADFRSNGPKELNSDSLKEALNTLKKYAKILEEPEPVTKDISFDKPARKPARAKIVKEFKGLFRRVKDKE